MIQGRLQKLAERELPDSQCWFRKSHSCTDMTFVVRQFDREGTRTPDEPAHYLYRPKKAYDSVPSKALLWMAMKKLGVPYVLIDIVRVFQEKMEARVRIVEEMLDEVEGTN